MDHKCPACDRELRGIADYPKVILKNVLRIPIPAEVQFNINDHTIYIGPNTGYGNPTPPVEVLDYFKNNPRDVRFKHQGWDWEIESRKRLIVMERRTSLADTLKAIFKKSPKINEATDWKFSSYRRSQTGNFSRETIMESINPYLDHLDSMVGREVNPVEIMPNFEGRRRISNTQYDVNLIELGGAHSLEEHLPVSAESLRMNVSPESRVSAIAISESEGGSISRIYFRAVVGRLEYEGKLLTS